MADVGARYVMGAPIVMVRREMDASRGGGWFSRIFPNLLGVRHALRARKKYGPEWGEINHKIYVCLDPKWIEVSEKDLEAWVEYDEGQIQAEIERIRALHGATPNTP